jgi:type VI secretion system secreted protein Hcp
MSIALYLKVEGASGESKDSKHKEWVDLDSFHWGVLQPSTAATGGGLGAGRAAFLDLTCVCSLDKANASLLGKCAQGDHIAKITVSASKAGGEQQEYYKVELEDVIVTAVDINGAEGAEIKASYSFQSGKLKTQYKEQTDKGTMGASTDFGWNIKENVKM